ncbi:DUF5700 domain-containing putative Zn-dependent protease [Schnuerera sp.]|uniref:DUF5700 domain-containing putative Zn-dependent protease n=1 Tax=Schnuerera sp. TaxID=2794844 RepID=UPI002CA7DA20|nr:DUF5700 domain-containing putative Zn-dependent protease [Schnuerera sp.]HSH34938.1 DUF5700 domain-containing putative Zn-dependent protease [Schnuerera sp.]
MINTDCIQLIIEILEKDFLDEKLYNIFIKTKGARGFLEHQSCIDNSIAKAKIKEELKKIIKDEYYEDEYEFYKLRKSLNQLKLDIQYINENADLLIKIALKKVYKIVPREMPIRYNIYLYSGGDDGGFTINRKKIFINYGKYIGEREEFINILSHEMYHSRKLPIRNKIIFLSKIMVKENRLLYETIGKSIEEGIACLVQHGPNLKKDDLSGNLTKRHLLVARDDFETLNNILMKIKSSKTLGREYNRLNIYVIGYLIVSIIYKEKGVLILDDWTINLNFRRIIEEYVELCNRNGVSTCINNEIAKWLVK